MGAEALADTGALLALLDADERWHEDCVAAFTALRKPLVTTAPVLTELFHLVGPRQSDLVWRFVRSGALTVAPVDDDDLAELERLMLRYADRPMDLADATLVLLAERRGLSTVFTVDHDDFETYRIGARGRFHVVPERRPPGGRPPRTAGGGRRG